MKKKIFMLLAMVMTVMTASADIVGYKLTAVKTTDDKGTLSFMIGQEAVEYAEAGKTVTVKIEAESGYAAKAITVKAVATWEAAKARRTRSGSIALLDAIETEKVKLNEYTFVMPDADVEVSAEYTFCAPVDAEEDKEGGKDVDNVVIEFDIDDTKTEIVGGKKVVHATVTHIEVPTQNDASASDKKEITVTVPGKITLPDGTIVIVDVITKDALQTPEGSNAVVTTVIIGESDTPIIIEDGAGSPNGTPINFVVPLDMLGDYSTQPGLKDNVDAGKVSALAYPKNKFWTFACGVDVDLPDGVDAYTCYITASGDVKINLIQDDELLVDGRRTIKHNNGVLLCNNSEKGGTYEMIGRLNGLMIATPATGDAQDYADNWLEPVIRKHNYPAGEYLVLKNNEFHEILENTSLTPACKALLRKTAPTVSSARKMSINK